MNSVNLVARVQGYLESIDYKDGAAVAKGTQLFGIERDVYQARLDQAKGQLAHDEAMLGEAMMNLTRYQTLERQDSIAAQRPQDQAWVVQQDKGAVQLDQATVDIANINLGYTRVLAPFDGIVTNRQVSVGELVGGDQPNVLATIVQLRPIWVWFNLSERDVQRVRAAVGAAANEDIAAHEVPIEVGLQTESGYQQRGVLDYANPSVDQSTGTLSLRGVFDNADGTLLPGYFVRVRVPMRPVSALLVPEEAIGSDQGGRYVLTVNANNIVERAGSSSVRPLASFAKSRADSSPTSGLPSPASSTPSQGRRSIRSPCRPSPPHSRADRSSGPS